MSNNSVDYCRSLLQADKGNAAIVQLCREAGRRKLGPSKLSHSQAGGGRPPRHAALVENKIPPPPPPGGYRELENYISESGDYKD